MDSSRVICSIAVKFEMRIFVGVCTDEMVSFKSMHGCAILRMRCQCASAVSYHAAWRREHPCFFIFM